MNDPLVQAEYETKVYDSAVKLATSFQKNPQGMEVVLNSWGATREQIDEVLDAMSSPDYQEVLIRGQMIDEGVYEALKDVLRPLNGF